MDFIILEWGNWEILGEIQKRMHQHEVDASIIFPISQSHFPKFLHGNIFYPEFNDPVRRLYLSNIAS